MQTHLQAVVTVLSLINPAICGMLFAAAEIGCSPRNRVVDATRAALAILTILMAAALAGTRLLDLFGISLDAFMVAGGGVLAWMGVSMLSGRASMTADTSSARHQDSSLTPLILFAASPGTITGVITISAAHTRLSFPTTAVVAVCVAVVVTWLALLIVASASTHGSRGGFVDDTLSRLMGLIVLSMGVQFMLTGFHAFAPR